MGIDSAALLRTLEAEFGAERLSPSAARAVLDLTKSAVEEHPRFDLSAEAWGGQPPIFEPLRERGLAQLDRAHAPLTEHDSKLEPPQIRGRRRAEED